MDGQRAEAHLRLLAEEELRRPAWEWGARRIRVGRVAELLTVIGALDDQVADRILADFHLALVVRQADVRRRGSLAARPPPGRSAAVRSGPATPVISPSPAPGATPGRLVRLGQVIPLRAEPAGGEVYLLSYAQTEAGPQLSLFFRSTRQDGLHNCLGRTVVHMHASGPMNQLSSGPEGLYYWPVTWICDDGGSWHATRILGRSGNAGGTALRVEVVPPLSRATTGIEVITTGRSAEARTRLPLRWE